MNMVVTMPKRITPSAVPGDQVRWMTASPRWNPLVQKQQSQQGSLSELNQPALLRFTTDTFMEDLIQLLQSNPEALEQQIAVPESFQARPVGASSDWQPPTPDQLKLYQPIHGFFYLVAASLVCHQPGLPDRVVNTASNEKVSFVLRRFNADGVEMAWVSNADGGGGRSWQPLSQLPLASENYAVVADGEELLPMFPLNFELNGRKRRLLVGLVPTSSRESYQAGQVAGAPPAPFGTDTDKNGQVKDPRLEELATFVIEPVEHLKSYAPPNLSNAPAGTPPPALEGSQFVLLDFAVFLASNLPQLWNALNTLAAPVSSDPSYALYTELTGDTVDGETTWRKALLDAFAAQNQINNGDVVLSYDLSQLDIGINGPNDPNNRLRTTLYNNVQAALGPYVPPTTPPTQGQITLIPKLDSSPTTLYALRCIYQRPQCEPFRPAVVGAPTAQFVLAPFFDFDAPSRPIRITMPVDTSVAGLRKFNKNVAFLISNGLRGQMERVTDLKKALDGKTGEEVQFDLGTICSFSIPIITICALFVLILFLILLNIVFWWLPFFRICLPIILPSKKSPGGS
jgi:hypothetical protein